MRHQYDGDDGSALDDPCQNHLYANVHAGGKRLSRPRVIRLLDVCQALPSYLNCGKLRRTDVHEVRRLAYDDAVTKLLDHAVETVRALSPERQDDLARVLLQLAGDDQSLVDLAPEEEAAVMRSREAAARGEFATDDQVRAVWANYGL